MSVFQDRSDFIPVINWNSLKNRLKVCDSISQCFNQIDKIFLFAAQVCKAFCAKEDCKKTK